METFNINEWVNPVENKHHTISAVSAISANKALDIENLIAQLEATHTDITYDYNDWFKVGAALAAEYGEGGRSYFHRISQLCSKYDSQDCDHKYDQCLQNPSPQVSAGTIFYLAQQAGVKMYSPTQERATDIPIKTGKSHKKSKEVKLTAITAYIKSHFNEGHDLRFDELSRKIQVLQNGQWRDLTDRDVNSITISCAEAVQTNITSADIHTVLQSDLVRAVNPLRDWLSRLPEYSPQDGQPSPIEQLASQVHVKGDQELFVSTFKKWFVAMVASWIYDSSVNQQALILISEKQGIFKTTWLEHLLPPELKSYVAKLASSHEFNKDDRMRVAEFALLNMDEIDAIPSRELNVLKSLITTADVNERVAYGRIKERRIRCASFCGSGNNRKFLTDDTGNRRWLPFEVDSIENPWDREEPYETIYGEALYLIEHKFQYWFDQEQTQSMAEHTDEFRAQTNEEELLPLYFTPADKDSTNALFLTASEIHEHLINMGHIMRPMGLTTFGILLRKAGFVRRSLSRGKGYLVIKVDSDQILRTQREQAAQLQQSLRSEEAITLTATDRLRTDKELPF